MVTMRVKAMFFDSKPVTRAVGKARRQALSRAGAFVRRTARGSMRRSKKPAAPGKPPHVHEGSLKRLLYFSYDSGDDTVVVGPLGFRKSEATSLLEFGGTLTAKHGRAVYDNAGRRTWLPAGERLDYEPRPYMRPALEKEAPNFPKMWLNSVRR